jgi:hypothetical protein
VTGLAVVDTYSSLESIRGAGSRKTVVEQGDAMCPNGVAKPHCRCAGSILGAVLEARTPQMQFRKGVIFYREELVVNGGSSFIRY